MKVYIGPYKNWIGPYQIAEALCFWVRPVKDKYELESKPNWVHDFGTWLSGGDKEDSWLYKFCLWVEKRRKRKIKIKIHDYDSWSVDHTLAIITLPLLKQLKETMHGSASVDLEDVPHEMRLTETEDYDAQLTFDFYKDENQKSEHNLHTRWNWVLDEMIFAFEHLVDDDWEDAFHKGVIDFNWKPVKSINSEIGLNEMSYGPAHTYEFDYEGLAKVNARIENGLRLFGKYYRGLWD